MFLGNEVEKLGEFISGRIQLGDRAEALHEIDQGRTLPSKQLIEYLNSLLHGNDEFVLLDEQKLVAETILALEKQARVGKRQVLVVEGGPGTGKSVLAVNLLAKLTSQERVAQYVTRNTAPRQVFEQRLTQSFSATRIRNLFKSAGSYINVEDRSIDALLVDEAHRLSPKSGPHGNLGENQVKEIVAASKLSVFFLDERQQVIFKDIGSRSEIEHWAGYFDAALTKMNLPSQFRCNGSDGYLSWLDHTLQIQETANTEIGDLNYDIRVFDSPNELYSAIEQQDQGLCKARVVAGYCWDWVSRSDKDAYDIVFPEFAFKRRWNLTEDGNYWILKPESISEIGCIHTCQGLEMGYVGVIIGKDLIVRDGQVVTDVTQRSKHDRSNRGYKTQSKKNPEQTKVRLDQIIKNTYRTLMSRGLQGCFIYAVDEETNDYFKHSLKR